MTWPRRRSRRVDDVRDSRITRLLLFLLAAASVASAETSSDPFLSRKEIVLPPRSRTIDSVDVTASCGDIGSGRRFAIDGRSADWQGEPTWIAGTGRYDRGEYVWTDYPYDDDGTGSFQYPGEGEALIAEAGTIGKASPRQTRYGSNAADVVEVRVAADDAFVYFLVRLNFLNAVDSTVVGLGLHLDDDPSSGLSSWPLGAGLATPGIDLFVTAHGPCAMVSDGADGAPIDDVGGAAAVGTADNVLEIALPRALLGGAERFRLVGGSGLWNPTERGWMKVQATPRTAQNASDQPKGAVTDRDPEVFNLFFRGDETTAEGCEGSASLREECQLGTPRAFQSTRQHQVLSEQTSGAYEVALDLARIDDPADSSDPPLLRRGDEHDFTRVYRSRVATEGVWVVANNAAVFLGRYQPYAVTLPACLEEGDCPWPAGKPPLVVLPHGGGQSHLGSAPRASIPEGGTDLYGVETAYAALEAEIAPVSVRPLGRGQRAPWWRGMGEADFLEVLEDARTRYRTDRERQVTVGASLGGYGTIRLASLYPDLWSGAFGHCPAEFENSISGRDVGN
ncbi:MAG: hypothetical protein QOD06_2168, partial [Candidatus Binatota bacterium]|nr:hypothetical protein [Candidatus Binatota bacterium]